MGLMTVGIIGLFFMLLLIGIGVPISFSLISIGLLGTMYIAGMSPALAQIGIIAWDKGNDFILVCIPLYILMGQLVFHTGMASEIYDCVQKWFGRLRGGLAIASVIACALFGAITGTSLAAVSTMGPIVVPEMKKYKYDLRLATGSLCASGTLGILIPPSIGFVFYGILTDTSIGDLFIAGIIPGIITAIVFSLCVFIMCSINPKLGPAGPRYPFKTQLLSLKNIAPIFIIFILVIGGIYLGIFTPTEASGIGVSAIIIICLFMKRLTWESFKRSVFGTGKTSAMIFVIVIGGYIFGRFLALTEISSNLINYILSLGLSPVLFIFFLAVMFTILGCILDVFGMLILTLPFVFPIVVNLGFDPVWFGVFVTIMTEIALITPPIGVNVFIMKGIAPEIPIADIFRGTMPFVLCEFFMIALITVFPGLTLWLVHLK